MADLESTINQILGDPDSMAQILSLAKSFGISPPKDDPPPGNEVPEPPAQSPLSDIPMGAMMELVQQAGSIDPREAQLLNALKPYCSKERQQRLDRALRIARISQIAGAALRTLNKKE